MATMLPRHLPCNFPKSSSCQTTTWSIAPLTLWASVLLEENTILCSACTLLWVGRGVQRIASSSWPPSLYHIITSAICKLSWLPNLIRCYISPLHHLPFLGSHLSSYPLTGKILQTVFWQKPFIILQNTFNRHLFPPAGQLELPSRFEEFSVKIWTWPDSSFSA